MKRKPRAAKTNAPTRDIDYDLERALILLGAAYPSGRYPDLVELEKSLAPLPAKDRKSTRLNSSHIPLSRMPSSA